MTGHSGVGLRERVMIEIGRPAEEAALLEKERELDKKAATTVQGAGLESHPEFERALSSPLTSDQMPVHDGAESLASALEVDLDQTMPTLESAIREVKLTYNRDPQTRRVMIAVPSTGTVRIEWHFSQQFMIRPVNWQCVGYAPTNFDVAEARNECVALALRENMDTVIFIDHDVCCPNDTLLRLCRHMMRGDKPVVSGLYYTKSNFPEPLVFRGRMNGPFYDWAHGDQFWCDGIPMGIAMIHTSVFRAMKPPYFVTPRMSIESDRGSGLLEGTEDLSWCSRVISEEVLQKAGWSMPDPKNPFWMDTAIFGQHIDREGNRFPECTGEDYKHDHAAARAAIAEAKKQAAAVESENLELVA